MTEALDLLGLSPPCPRCAGSGWLDPIGPCPDGSYITSRPCPDCDTAQPLLGASPTGALNALPGASATADDRRTYRAGSARMNMHGIPYPSIYRGAKWTTITLTAGEVEVSLFVDDPDVEDYEKMLLRCVAELRRMRGSPSDTSPSPGSAP